MAVILVLLLFGNWLINVVLIFIPVSFFIRLTHLGWWGLALLTVLFLAWCMAED
ncbi:hypothetical protein I4641_03190 [Waterburya agarophytonicola K14]|uniref:Uncharacterized protein n=1 Tax=Waterburya agarophytonicola KI4 TaxID=2874699 RepID=A0A964BQC4_9CYAN|nr:hypothetical protein [Waterburya agarophytonicola KI4]